MSEKGRYRTGELPEVGDRVSIISEFTVLAIGSGNREGLIQCRCDSDDDFDIGRHGWVHPDVCRLISRDVTAPACGCETCLKANPDDWRGKVMIVCPQCGNKRCPKATFHGHACTNSNASGQVGSSFGPPAPAEPAAESCKACDGTGQVISPEPFCKVGLCRECNANGERFTNAPPAAVITGPGKYRSFYKKTLVNEIVGKSEGGLWVGVDSDGNPEAWRDDGMPVSDNMFSEITGPYAPQPEPVVRPYTLVEAATLLLDKPVIRKGLLQYGPNIVEDICRKSVQIPYSGWVLFEEMAKEFTFVDGSPCGVPI